MLREVGVQHLRDSGDLRPPGPDRGLRAHVRNVQDRPASTRRTVEAMRFDTKVAILLRDDLETWQRLNVTAFLTSGIAARYPQIIGEPYADADGTAYLSMFGQPVLVLEGSKDVLTAAHERCLRRNLEISVFTADLFRTGNDDDNRAAVAAVPRRRPGPRRPGHPRPAQRRRQDPQGRVDAPLGTTGVSRSETSTERYAGNVRKSG